MSRENKLALIIGFALILFVGVLVSDHLSSYNRQVTNALPTAIDPLRDATTMIPVLVEYDLAPTPTVDVPPTPAGPAQQTPMRMHVVAESDTIMSICRAWYGDAAFTSRLAAYNRLPDPNRLSNGMRLLIPEATVLLEFDVVEPTASPPPPTLATTEPAPPPTPAAQGTYTVQPGDTLSEIAQKLMGTSRATVALFEINRSVLPSMDALQVGMRLQYPLPPS